jgi:HEAT repeat protein
VVTCHRFGLFWIVSAAATLFVSTTPTEKESGDRSPHSKSFAASAFLIVLVLIAGCGPGSNAEKGETDLLLEHLRSGGTQYRAHAARRLGELKHEPAVEPLTAALLDSEEQVRLAAIEALGQIGTPQVIDPLCRALRSQAWTERRAAARALGATSDSACVEPLIAMLADENAGAAGAAVQSLIAIGQPAVGPLIELVRKTTAEMEDWPPLEKPATSEEDGEEGPDEKKKRKKHKSRKDKQEDPNVIQPPEPEPVDPEVARRRAVVEKAERAAYALGEIGDSRAVDVIKPLLGLPYPALNVTAAVALHEFGEPEAIEFLVGRLGTDDPMDATMARTALERMGLAALDPLGRALAGGETEQRREAAQLLARLSDPRVLEPLLAASVDPDGRVRDTAERELQSRLALDTTLDELLAALEDDNASVRRTALTLIDRSGQAFPLDAVTPLLQDEDAVVRAAAATILGQRKDESTLKPLDRLIKDKDDRVRFAAAAAVAGMGDRRANDMFVDVVKTGDIAHPHFVTAIRALGDTADERAVDHLLPLLTMKPPKDRNEAKRIGKSLEPTRAAAVRALGQIGDRRAVRPIARLIEGEGKPSHGVPYVEVGEALGRLGDPAAFKTLVNFIQRAAFRTHGAIRRPAMRALAQIDPERAIDALIEQLHQHVDPVDWEQNHDICLIFAELKDPRTIPVLAERLATDAPEQRRDSAQALIAVVRENIPEAIAAMEEVSAGGRAGLASALAEVGEPAREQVIEALQSESEKIRHGAAWAIGETKDPNLAEDLLSLVEDKHAEVRAAAAWSLGQLEYEPAVEALIALLDDAETKPRRSAANALGSFKDERVVAALAATWDDPEPQVRNEVLLSIMRTGSPQSRDVLQKALNDEDADVRGLATQIVKDVARDLRE